MESKSRGQRGRKPTGTENKKRSPRTSQRSKQSTRSHTPSRKENASGSQSDSKSGKGKFSGSRERKPYSGKKETPPRYHEEKPPVRKRNFTEDTDGRKSSEYSRKRPASLLRHKNADRPSEDLKTTRYRRPSGDFDKPATRRPRPVKSDPNAPIRLNKFIANAGVCSRREADKLIETGAVKVNGVIVTELGTKVSPSDKVQLGDQTLSSEKLRYVLLNKPKGYITTTDDPFKRNTVMKLVEDACKERIYPVGRLDRNTTGLLLFTNDGDLAKRLTHPRFGIRKIYDVELDKPLSKRDMESIAAGVELDGEIILIDDIAYVNLEKNKKHIGIELHSGQNRVVRRIFEKFGYEVVKLDRVMIGSLTKKDLQRGRWRHLTDLEVRMLKRL